MNCYRLCISLRSYTKNGVNLLCNAFPSICRAYSTHVPNWRQKWFDPVEVDEMSRRDLQKWCKKLNIRANSKTTQLRRDLLSYHTDTLSTSTILNYPFLPATMPSNLNLTPQIVRQEKNLFTYSDLTHSNSIDVNVSGLLGVRHYQNIPCDPEETHEGVVDVAASTNYGKVPSVSGILRATAPKGKLFAIMNWTRKQKALLGEDVFRQQMSQIKRNGINFHRFIHKCLVDRSLNTKVSDNLQGYVESTKTVFSKLGDAIGSEKTIRHAHLGYKGRVDTLACYNGDPCVIEWKTSQKKKPCLADCGDYPIQVVAYAGAVNSDTLFGFKVKRGLIVVAYEDGMPADVHCLDFNLCRNIWEDWLLRVHQFYNRET